ncbi:MAG: NUDIX hydrolase [Planctomycetes bacterium]|nr:NUDIX hydrolase [Planctomycetota bacterium]
MSNEPRIFAPRCTTLQPVEVVHENPWFSVLNRGGYYTVEPHQLQVIVLPVVEEQRIVMVRVKRPVMADALLELPAGAVQDQETPVQAAARELAEETGIVVNDPGRFEVLPPVCVNPNRNPLLASTFRVSLSLQEYESRTGSDDEIAEVVLLDYAQIVDRMCAGAFFVTTPMAVIARHLLGSMYGVNKH